MSPNWYHVYSIIYVEKNSVLVSVTPLFSTPKKLVVVGSPNMSDGSMAFDGISEKQTTGQTTKRQTALVSFSNLSP
jgi:hypothetical protein